MWLRRELYGVTQGYFELFGLDSKFNIDVAMLESNFRKIQSDSHPDRFVTATPAEKLKSMQLATLANEGYQTLKQPANRAKYLLELQGIEAISETNTAMPMDFLMQQLEWREAIDDAKNAKDISGLDNLLRQMQQEANALNTTLTLLIDKNHDYQAATEATRKLIFIDKVCMDINKVIEKLEDLN